MSTEEQVAAIKSGDPVTTTKGEITANINKVLSDKLEEEKTGTSAVAEPTPEEAKEKSTPVENNTQNTDFEIPSIPEPSTEPAISVDLSPDVKIGEVPIVPIDISGIGIESTDDAASVEPAETNSSEMEQKEVINPNPLPIFNEDTVGPSYTRREDNTDLPLNQTENSMNTYDDLANGIELEKVADVVASVEDAKRLNNATNEAIIKVVNESFKKLEKAMAMLEEADSILAASEENTPGKRWYDKEVAWRRSYRGLKVKNEEESYKSANEVPFSQKYNDNIIQFPQSNFNDGQNNDFGGNRFVA